MDSAGKKIWDLPLRICHWLTVAAILFAWYSIEFSGNMDHHFYAGYTALTLILFRLVWGLCGPGYARFSTFFFPLREIKAYSQALFQRHSPRYAGHNPLGAIFALVLILLILIQTVTGLFASDGDYVFGPLAELIPYSISDAITEWHEININILWGFIALHILAVLFYQWYKKQNIIGAMFTGRKAGLGDQWEEITNSRLTVALPLLLAIALGVYGISRLGY